MLETDDETKTRSRMSFCLHFHIMNGVAVRSLTRLNAGDFGALQANAAHETTLVEKHRIGR